MNCPGREYSRKKFFGAGLQCNERRWKGLESIGDFGLFNMPVQSTSLPDYVFDVND